MNPLYLKFKCNHLANDILADGCIFFSSNFLIYNPSLSRHEKVLQQYITCGILIVGVKNTRQVIPVRVLSFEESL